METVYGVTRVWEPRLRNTMPGRDLEERLLSYLREHPGSGPREIADALGEPVQRIRLVLARLRDRGLVARGEEGRYYAVAHLVKGISRRDLRSEKPRQLSPDIEALVIEIEELKRRIIRLENRIKELETLCLGKKSEQ